METLRLWTGDNNGDSGCGLEMTLWTQRLWTGEDKGDLVAGE